ncbi:unnamed protein product [Rhizophagus irregularis]|nr:unnamed protein product [Rhizophagus irregularis]
MNGNLMASSSGSLKRAELRQVFGSLDMTFVGFFKTSLTRIYGLCDFLRFWTRGRSIRNFNKDKDNNKRNNTVESEKQVRPTSRTSSNNRSCILDSDGLLFGLNTLDLGTSILLFFFRQPVYWTRRFQ